MRLATALLATGVSCLATARTADLIRSIGGGGRTRLATWIAVEILAAYGVLVAVRPEGWLLVDLVVIAAAGAGGVLLSRFVPSRSALVSFCLVASVVDVFSVSGGLTSAIVEAHRSGTSELLRVLAISAPSAEGIRPVVGIGDLIIVATVFAAMTNLGYRWPAAVAGPTLGLLVAVPVAFWVGGIWGIPFIAAGTIAALVLSRPESPRS